MNKISKSQKRKTLKPRKWTTSRCFRKSIGSRNRKMEAEAANGCGR